MCCKTADSGSYGECFAMKHRIEIARRLVVCVFAAASLVLGGCLPERIDGARAADVTFDYHIDKTNYSTMRSTTPLHIREQVGSAISVDADVIMPETVAASVYCAEPAFSVERLREIESFLPDDVVLEKFETTTADSAYWKLENFAEAQCKASNGGLITIACDYVGLMPDAFVARFDGVDYGACNSELGPPYAKAELSGFPSDDAKQEVLDFLKAIGADNVLSIEAYAMSANAMQQAKGQYVEEMIESYRELDDYESGAYAQEIADLEKTAEIRYGIEDEMYSVHVLFEEEGVPLNTLNYGNRLGMEAGASKVGQSYLHAYVGKNGIQFIDSMNLLRKGSALEDAAGSESLISLDEALGALAARFGSVVHTDTTRIDQASLEYCALIDPDSETGVVLVPAWVFRNAEDPDYGIRISALTGEVI